MWTSPPHDRRQAPGESPERGGASGPVIGDGLSGALIVGMVLFAMAMVGLASKHAFSVSFWPANAVLAGMMLRWPRLRRPLNWVAAAAGLIAGDLLFGRSFPLAASFAATNIISVLTAVAVLGRLDPRDLTLRRVHSVPIILAALLPACLIAALCGAVLVVVQFNGSATQALMTWPASELVNYLVTLPAMLTVGRSPGMLGAAGAKPMLRQAGPVIALILSCAAAAWFDGPGSIMYPLPALLLCALTYRVATTALITMALGTACLTMTGLGIMDFGQDMSIPGMVVSVRIAIAFLVLVPLTITSAMAVRDELMDQLRQAADHDGLTGLLNRRAFEARMRDRIDAKVPPGRSRVVLWIDIDHFKAVNDRHGHLAGDAVLRAFAATARACCRKEDLIGRLGGEEFALVAEVAGCDAAIAVAERLRRAFADQVVTWNGEPVRATVSIGACHVERPERDIGALIHRLDEALYRAKRMGRNRIEWLGHVQQAYPALRA